MKKTFKTFALMLLTALAFSSCVDVPAPYNLPDKNSNSGEGGGGTTIEPKGDGTAASPYNVAAIVAKIQEMEAGVESTQEYYIKGKVLSVKTDAATISQYGNHTFTMVDEGSTSPIFTAFQVYGPDKKKFTSVDDIKVGDEVVVCGKVVNYRGNTPETVGKGAAYVVSINSEGGSGNTDTPSSSKDKPLTISQAKTASGNNYVKGYIVGYVDGQKLADGAKFAVPSSAETEILLAETPDETNPDNVLPVQLPAGDVRSALELSAHPDYLKKEVLLYGSLETYFGVLGMKSTSWGSIDGKTFGIDPDGGGSGDIDGQEGDGTATSPYNVAAIVAKIQTMPAGVESDEEYYIKGKVSSVSTTASTISQYGNHTFTMVDEGKTSPVFTAFQVYGPGKKKFTSVDDIKVGDEVVVCGKVVNYRGNTPETVGKGAAYVVSINSEGGGQGGGGGEQGDIQHISIAEFLAKADVNTTYELTGTVKNISNTTYGNFDLVEGDASIYIYGLLDLDGNKQKFSSLGIAEGDEVTLTGKYKLYKDKPEIENAQFVSVKKGDGGGGQGGDDSGGQGGGGDPVTDLVNGDFENWVSDSQPAGWKSASSASNATLSKSTDARGGNFSCMVAAPGTQNKRLATQEMTLEAGSYTFSFYAKSTTGDKCQTRGGYVPVKEDGSVGAYTYNKTYTDLNNGEWTLVSYDFELASKTTLCLVVMNPKGSSYSVSQDILVDDATLVKK
ncbi:MAG: DUF6359 domain-containing protein [Bacteroidaceae bacterium]|nr:DUF6359 domain-containing protein [Bacteroidaceae bacterium]